MAAFPMFLSVLSGYLAPLVAPSGPAPYLGVQLELGFEIMEYPNDMPQFPGEPPSNGNIKKLVIMSWGIALSTSPTEPNVEVEKLTLVARGASGSKQLVFEVNDLNEHMTNYSEGSDLPVRCFSSQDGMVSLEAEAWVRSLGDDGSPDREARPRRFVVKKMPPYIQPRDRHTGGLSELCTRK